MSEKSMTTRMLEMSTMSGAEPILVVTTASGKKAVNPSDSSASVVLAWHKSLQIVRSPTLLCSTNVITKKNLAGIQVLFEACSVGLYIAIP